MVHTAKNKQRIWQRVCPKNVVPCSLTPTFPAGMTVALVTFLWLLTLLITQVASSNAAPPPTPPAPQPAATPSAATQPALDGFKLTVEYWNELEKLARDVQQTVETLSNKSTEKFSADTSRRLAYFNTTLAEKYSGAKYDGVTGYVPLPNHLEASFDQYLKVRKITEVSPVVGRPSSRIYHIQERKFECNYGPNSLTCLVNKENNGNSLFSEVKSTVFQNEIEKIFSSGPTIRTAASAAGVAVLNDAYQLFAAPQGVRMDNFAEDFLLTEKTYNLVLNHARTAYRQRHASEFSPANTAKAAESVALPDSLISLEKVWEDIESHGPLAVGGIILGVLALLTALCYGVWRLFRNMRRDSVSDTPEPDLEDFDVHPAIEAHPSLAPVIPCIDIPHPVEEEPPSSELAVLRNTTVPAEAASLHEAIESIQKGEESVQDQSVSMIPAEEATNITVDCLVERTVAEAVDKAVAEAVDKAVAEAVEKAVAEAVDKAVVEAVDKAVAEVVWRQVTDTLGETVDLAVEKQVANALDKSVANAVDLAIVALLDKKVADAVARPVAMAIDQAVDVGVSQPVTEAIEKAVAAGVDQPVAEAVSRAVAALIESRVEQEVTQAIEQAVVANVAPLVTEAIEKAVASSVDQPVAVAVSRAISTSIVSQVPHAVIQPVALAIEQVIATGVALPVAAAIEQAVATGVKQPVAEAVSRAVAIAIERTVPQAVVEPVAAAVEEEVAARVKQQVAEAVSRTAAPMPGKPEHADRTVSVGIEQGTSLDCALCGKKMKVGTATKGANAGRKFRVCSDYPTCGNIVPISN